MRCRMADPLCRFGYFARGFGPHRQPPVQHPVDRGNTDARRLGKIGNCGPTHDSLHDVKYKITIMDEILNHESANCSPTHC